MKLRKPFSLIICLIPLIITFSGCKKDNGESQLDKDIEIIETYLLQHQLQAQKHESGLFYIIEEPGTGQKPSLYSTIMVYYKGYLMDSTVFDQTQTNEPLSLYLYQTIEGWQKGIPLFNEGGKGTLFIPSPLGYGNQTVGDIPANSILIFDIHLLQVAK